MFPSLARYNANFDRDPALCHSARHNPSASEDVGDVRSDKFIPSAA
jgi:hypothetical protein